MPRLRRACLLTCAAGLSVALSACAAPELRVHATPTPLVARTTGSPTALPSGSPSTSPSATPIPASQDPVVPSVNVTAEHPQDGLPPVLHRIETTDPVVFITIDDGYAKDPAVIALLKARGAVVTPFLAHNAITDDPGYFRTLEQATGQVPQDHSMTHPFLTRLGFEQQKAQICGAAAAYQKLYGTRPWLFRPPYGAYNTTTRHAAKACGMTTLVLWDASMPHSVIRYAGATRFHPGDILLIHWRPKLAHDLAIALDTIAADGLRVASLQDYLPRPA